MLTVLSGSISGGGRSKLDSSHQAVRSATISLFGPVTCTPKAIGFKACVPMVSSWTSIPRAMRRLTTCVASRPLSASKEYELTRTIRWLCSAAYSRANVLGGEMSRGAASLCTSAARPIAFAASLFAASIAMSAADCNAADVVYTSASAKASPVTPNATQIANIACLAFHHSVSSDSPTQPTTTIAEKNNISCSLSHSADFKELVSDLDSDRTYLIAEYRTIAKIKAVTGFLLLALTGWRIFRVS